VKPSDRFYMVCTSIYGSRTHVTYDTLEELCVDNNNNRIHGYDVYSSFEEIIEFFGEEISGWPSAVLNLMDSGSNSFVHVGQYNEHGYWIDANKMTGDLRAKLLIEAICEWDDGSITVILTEDEAADAVRDGRTDCKYGREMNTARALELYGVKPSPLT
jgi:hypothetical protein